MLAAMLLTVYFGLLSLDTASKHDNRDRITQILKSTYSTLVQLEQIAQRGQLSEEQAKQLATQIMRENKYKDNKYVYVADDKLTFWATPHAPSTAWHHALMTFAMRKVIASVTLCCQR